MKLTRAALVPLAAMSAILAVALTLILGIVARSPYTHQHIMETLDPTFNRTALAFAGEVPEMGSVPAVLDREVSFAKDVLPILKENCAACHSPLKYSAPPGGADLTSYETIMKVAEDDDHEDEEEVARAEDHDEEQPQAAAAKDDDHDKRDAKPASAEDDDHDEDEQKMAAAKDDDHDGKDEMVAGVKADRHDEEQPMMAAKDGDHEGEKEEAGGHGRIVAPGEPEESELVAVLRSPRMAMPPITTAPLSEEQKRIITTWIAQGAKNN